MEPHEKAEALIKKFKTASAAEDLALIAVYEIISALEDHEEEDTIDLRFSIRYWNQVKHKILTHDN